MRFVSNDVGFLDSDDGHSPTSDSLTIEQDMDSETCFEERKARLVRKVTISFIRECLDLDISRLTVPAP
jgi:predicted thioredoxin/glutaredoxin